MEMLQSRALLPVQIRNGMRKPTPGRIQPFTIAEFICQAMVIDILGAGKSPLLQYLHQRIPVMVDPYGL